MHTKRPPLGLSAALGFWVNHSLAMEELYDVYAPEGTTGAEEEEELDNELRAIWNVPEHRNRLEQVFQRAEEDRDVLLSEAASELEGTFSKKESQLICKKRGSRDPWVRSFYVSPRRGSFPRGPLWLTVSIGVGDISDQILHVSVWSKGGKAVARILAMGLVEADDRSGYTEEGWASGGVIISRIKLSQCLNAESVSVDMGAVMHRLVADLGKQTSETLVMLAKSLKA